MFLERGGGGLGVSTQTIFGFRGHKLCVKCKKSEIRLKSENFDPWGFILFVRLLTKEQEVLKSMIQSLFVHVR